jgi:hypothetical protein
MPLTIQEEQQAFEQVRDRLLTEHRGEFVLFKDGQVVGFFPTHTEAYAAGLEKFGPDAVFLVAQVAAQTPSTSISWELGVMFG